MASYNSLAQLEHDLKEAHYDLELARVDLSRLRLNYRQHVRMHLLMMADNNAQKQNVENGLPADWVLKPQYAGSTERQVRNPITAIRSNELEQGIEELELTVANRLQKIEQLKAEKDYEEIRQKYQRVVQLSLVWDAAVKNQSEKSPVDKRVEWRLKQLRRLLADRLASNA